MRVAALLTAQLEQGPSRALNRHAWASEPPLLPNQTKSGEELHPSPVDDASMFPPGNPRQFRGR